MKKQFRIYLHSCHSVAEKLALLSARSNASANPFSLDDFTSIVKAEKMTLNTLYKDITSTVDNHSFTLKEGDRILVIIEETLVHELSPQEN